jgi:hypothetical protein
MQLEFRPPQQQRDIGRPPDRVWTFPDGSPWTTFFEWDDRILLRFPDVADFELPAARECARCTPAPGAHPDTLLHVWQNQVVPLVMSSEGNLVLHASAVSIDGCAVAFVGASMEGKSTLAASFGLAGFHVFGDDVLRLVRDDRWQAYPGADCVRLRADAHAALVGGADAQGDRKTMLSHERLVFTTEPQPLGRIYFLAPSMAGRPGLRPLPAQDAVIELVKHSFLLDIRSADSLAAHFCQVTALAAEVRCTRLEMPRDFASLARVRSMVIHDLETATDESRYTV